MARKPKDWERIELDYRAGVKSLREIGEEHGVSHVSIIKKAKQLGWSRDLNERIRQKADELVTKELVTSKVTRVPEGFQDSERATIDANARAIADVKLSHRRDIPRARSVSMGLLAELELQTGVENVQLLEQLGDMMHNPDEKGIDKLNELYRKVISLPNRAKTMKDLGESMRVLIGLERQAFNFEDEDASPNDALQAVLDKVAKTNGNGFMPVAQDPEFED